MPPPPPPPPPLGAAAETVPPPLPEMLRDLTLDAAAIVEILCSQLARDELRESIFADDLGDDLGFDWVVAEYVRRALRRTSLGETAQRSNDHPRRGFTAAECGAVYRWVACGRMAALRRTSAEAEVAAYKEVYIASATAGLPPATRAAHFPLTKLIAEWMALPDDGGDGGDGGDESGAPDVQAERRAAYKRCVLVGPDTAGSPRLRLSQLVAGWRQLDGVRAKADPAKKGWRVRLHEPAAADARARATRADAIPPMPSPVSHIVRCPTNGLAMLSDEAAAMLRFVRIETASAAVQIPVQLALLYGFFFRVAPAPVFHVTPETLSLAEQRLQEKDFALMGYLVAKVVAREPSTGIYSMTDDTEVRHRIVRVR